MTHVGEPMPGEEWEAYGIGDTIEIVRIGKDHVPNIPGLVTCTGGVNGLYKKPGDREPGQFQLIRRVGVTQP